MIKERFNSFRKGVAIPASPLALDSNRTWDKERQKWLYRYYEAAGAGGVAVAVHSTQFEIREPQYGLFEPVLRLAADELKRLEDKRQAPFLRIAGVCGCTEQAVAEATLAIELGYDAALLSLAALKEQDIPQLLNHCRQVAQIIPVIGFYLQPAVGGRELPYEFWVEFAEIENVIAVKMAPFNRYQTLDVIRAISYSKRCDEITLYTGNDDNIVVDLLTPYCFNGKTVYVRGGLLGQWCVWTKTAVELLGTVHRVLEGKEQLSLDLLTKAAQLTDANAAVFDAKNQFAGCIPGIHEVLRRQGLLETIHCLNPHEVLSSGQAEELTRIAQSYPWIIDDKFVQDNIASWQY